MAVRRCPCGVQGGRRFDGWIDCTALVLSGRRWLRCVARPSSCPLRVWVFLAAGRSPNSRACRAARVSPPPVRDPARDWMRRAMSSPLNCGIFADLDSLGNVTEVCWGEGASGIPKWQIWFPVRAVLRGFPSLGTKPDT